MAKDSKSVGFKLIKIETNQFAIHDENFYEDKTIEISSSLSFSINDENRNFMASVKFIYKIEEKPFITIGVNGVFNIEESSWESFIKESGLIFPKGFVAHMTMLTIGATRGILHEKTIKSKFNKFLLPTINVANMIKKDVEFDLV